MKPMCFKAGRRTDGRWSVFEEATQVSALPPSLEQNGIGPTDAALLAATLNVIVRSTLSADSGEALNGSAGLTPPTKPPR